MAAEEATLPLTVPTIGASSVWRWTILELSSERDLSHPSTWCWRFSVRTKYTFARPVERTHYAWLRSQFKPKSFWMPEERTLDFDCVSIILFLCVLKLIKKICVCVCVVCVGCVFGLCRHDRIRVRGRSQCAPVWVEGLQDQQREHRQ